MKVMESTVKCVGAKKATKVSIHAADYRNNGRLAIDLLAIDDFPEPFASLTVNMPDNPCPEGEVYIKDWAENNEIWPALTWAIENKIIEPSATHVVVSGYVNVKRYKLHQHFLSLLAVAKAKL